MPRCTWPEYRSEVACGSKPVSAIGKVTRSTLPGSPRCWAAVGAAARTAAASAARKMRVTSCPSAARARRLPRRLAPGGVDVEVLPRVLVERVVLEPGQPRVDEHVLVAEHRD